MANFVEQRAFNLMGMFNVFEEYLNTGDPILREWFLVKSNFWPITLCCLYLLTIKVIGPYYMRNRKPYELRKTMVAYNIFLVTAYATCLSIIGYRIAKIGPAALCKKIQIHRKDYRYAVVVCGWIVYLLKYVEFLDTIFFVLRKKDKLITNLHVIHHTLVPVIGWILFRTETSGFMAYPVIVNSVVHIIMYSYYALAAMGPKVRKYLWWKRYLTIMQMTQFVLLILLHTVIMPATGCTAAKSSLYMNFVVTPLFFVLFFNFYLKSFKITKPNSAGTSENGNFHLHSVNNVCDELSNDPSKIKCN